MDSDPDQRGCDGELRRLLQRHPRETWRTHGSVSVEVWLGAHDRFRRESAELQAALDDYGARRATVQQLAAGSAPRLHAMTAALEGHHEIEDSSYFPVLRAAHPVLAMGFDALADDHAALQRATAAAAAALEELMAALGGARDQTASRLAAERFRDASGRLYRRLDSHLRDEEDLIIPLLLERGEYDAGS